MIDLHGAGEDNPRLFKKQKVELGTGSQNEYLPADVSRTQITILNKHLGKDVTYRNGMPSFRAEGVNRIASFAFRELKLHSVQIDYESIRPRGITKDGFLCLSKENDIWRVVFCAGKECAWDDAGVGGVYRVPSFV